MQSFSYQNGEGLGSRQWAFRPLLFQSLPYLKAQFPSGGFVSFTLEESEKIFAVIHFAIMEDRWVSQPGSPFGGLSAAGEVRDTDAGRLVQHILSQSGGSPVNIFLPFENYPGSGGGVFRQALEGNGFTTLYIDIHQYIELEEGKTLEERMHKSQLRRLSKCQEAGFVFSNEPAGKLAEVHGFIGACRAEQGLEINIPLPKLKEAIDNWPGTYHIFTLRGEGRLIAACITATVSDEVLYYYLPAASKAYSTFSPMVLLVHGLYNWAVKNGYRLLDLGKTSVDGAKQKGLFTFKERMGAVSGERRYLSHVP